MIFNRVPIGLRSTHNHEDAAGRSHEINNLDRIFNRAVLPNPFRSLLERTEPYRGQTIPACRLPSSCWPRWQAAPVTTGFNTLKRGDSKVRTWQGTFSAEKAVQPARLASFASRFLPWPRRAPFLGPSHRDRDQRALASAGLSARLVSAVSLAGQVRCDHSVFLPLRVQRRFGRPRLWLACCWLPLSSRRHSAVRAAASEYLHPSMRSAGIPP